MPNDTLPAAACHWRADIDSLAFRPRGHEGLCVVHRRAFRTLLGDIATPEQCAAYFGARHATFERAAEYKITRARIGIDANLHLNSRDIRRAIGAQCSELRERGARRPLPELFQDANRGSGDND